MGVSVGEEEHIAIERICSNGMDEAIIAKWVQQLKGKTFDRLLVITSFRMLTFKKSHVRSIKVSKNFSLLNLKSMAVNSTDEGMVLEVSFILRAVL